MYVSGEEKYSCTNREKMNCCEIDLPVGDGLCCNMYCTCNSRFFNVYMCLYVKEREREKWVTMYLNNWMNSSGVKRIHNVFYEPWKCFLFWNHGRQLHVKFMILLNIGEGGSRNLEIWFKEVWKKRWIDSKTVHNHCFLRDWALESRSLSGCFSNFILIIINIHFDSTQLCNIHFISFVCFLIMKFPKNIPVVSIKDYNLCISCKFLNFAAEIF